MNDPGWSTIWLFTHSCDISFPTLQSWHQSPHVRMNDTMFEINGFFGQHGKPKETIINQQSGLLLNSIQYLLPHNWESPTHMSRGDSIVAAHTLADHRQSQLTILPSDRQQNITNRPHCINAQIIDNCKTWLQGTSNIVIVQYAIIHSWSLQEHWLAITHI